MDGHGDAANVQPGPDFPFAGSDPLSPEQFMALAQADPAFLMRFLPPATAAPHPTASAVPSSPPPPGPASRPAPNPSGPQPAPASASPDSLTERHAEALPAPADPSVSVGAAALPGPLQSPGREPRRNGAPLPPTPAAPLLPAALTRQLPPGVRDRWLPVAPLATTAWSLVLAVVSSEDDTAAVLKCVERAALPGVDFEALRAAVRRTEEAGPGAVAAVYDVELTPDYLFIVQERFECSLQDVHVAMTARLERTAQPRLTPATAVSIMRQLCEALLAIHETGAAHGAVRPPNVLLRQHDTGVVARWAPWGLPARHGSGDELVSHDTYFSPHQIHNMQLNAAEPSQEADIFALACVLCELATWGRHPFAGEGDTWPHYCARLQMLEESRTIALPSTFLGEEVGTLALLFWDLVHGMLTHKSRDMADVLAHPFFWDPADFLNFFAHQLPGGLADDIESPERSGGVRAFLGEVVAAAKVGDANLTMKLVCANVPATLTLYHSLLASLQPS